MSIDWKERWDQNRIGFHKPEVNPKLVEHAATFKPGGRVLVPLCGKSVDLGWLAAQGYEPVGVELVEKAAREHFHEAGVTPEREGPMFTGGGVRIHVGDMLAFQDATGFDAVWDRAALIALPPEVRGPYAAHLLSLLKPGGAMLLVTLSYDQSLIEGPPFSVDDDEVRAHYAAEGKLTLLNAGEGSGSKRMQDEGVVVREALWSFSR